MYPTASTLFCLGERGGLCFGQGRGLSTTSVVPNLNASLTDRPTDLLASTLQRFVSSPIEDDPPALMSIRSAFLKMRPSSAAR